MKILVSYLKRYKGLVFLTLILATINQVFSLLDPMIFGKLLDKFISHPKDYTQSEFVNGVMFFIALAIVLACRRYIREERAVRPPSRMPAWEAILGAVRGRTPPSRGDRPA